jgi:hypothetical protein
MKILPTGWLSCCLTAANCCRSAWHSCPLQQHQTKGSTEGWQLTLRRSLLLYATVG